MRAHCTSSTFPFLKCCHQIIGSILLSSLIATAYAEGEGHAHHHNHEDEDEFHVEQHGAHEHGAATVQIVYAEAKLQIKIDSPAFNLIGFEYTPRSEQEHKKVADLRSLAADAQNIVQIFPEQVCDQSKQAISSELFVGDDSAHEHEHEHDKTHNDIEIHYEFDCKQAPHKLSFKIFESFGALDKMDAQLVTEDSQSAKTLTPRNPDISL